MKPKRIILIRHGESEGNIDRNLYNQKPDFALLLTDKGRAQAQVAGNKLFEIVGNDQIQFYVSPLFRTQQTFQQIIQHFPLEQYSWREEPRLREQEWGHLRSIDVCRRVDKERDGYGTFYYRITDGESGADVYDRVSDFFHTLFRDFEKKEYFENAIMITHGMTIRLFLMRWFHYTVSEFEELANPANCDMVIMELGENNKYKLATEMKRRKAGHQWSLEQP